jgi:two-component system, cell cycle sensor histidine kinase and response regulator CckA
MIVQQAIKILLVEDNPGDALLIQEILAEISSVKFDLVHVERLNPALEQLKSQAFDVILLDLLLPDSQGFETFVRVHSQSGQIPIVVLTGLNDETLAIQAMQAGAQDYLVKGQVSGSDLLMRSIRYAIERKRIQADLYRREQEFRTLAENAPDIIARFDHDFRHLYVNRAVEAATGLSAQDFLGKTNREMGMPEMQVEQWEHVLQQVFRTGEQMSFDFEFPTSNGLRYYQSRCVPEFRIDGTVESVLGITRDVTEQKQLEAQFLRAQRLESLGTLASGIAHDLNNILTPILAIAQLLPRHFPELAEPSQRLLTILEDNAKRGAALVQQILTFARGWDGDRDLAPLEVRGVFEELAQIIQSTFPKSIEMIRDVPQADLWLVSVDSTQLHQVLLNLCVNARDAMPSGGKLRLRAENFRIDQAFAQLHLGSKIGPYVLITISDTGVGIAPDIQERIFEPFFTTKSLGKGTGLGLSTVLGIVKSCGGFVEVASQPGNGSQFKVYLPAITFTTPKNELRAPLLQGQGQLILLVDDEPNILETLKTILEAYNYRVLTASNGVESVACYAQNLNEIDLVLMDMMMPEMGGITAIQTLKELNPQVKIIAISGLDANYHQQAKRFGITTFLAKPFPTTDLLQALHRQLS